MSFLTYTLFMFIAASIGLYLGNPNRRLRREQIKKSNQLQQIKQA